MMKVLGNTENKIHKNKDGEKVPHLEITEETLVRFNVVSNDYQLDSRILFTFVPNKSLNQLLDASRKKLNIFRNF